MLKKSALILSVILSLNAISKAQESCKASLSDAPVLFGLKLGMSLAQAQAVLGARLKIKPMKIGEGSFFQNFIDRPAPSNLSGVRALFLRFFEHKLYQIEVFYEDRNEWKTLGDFTSSLSANLNLAANAWNTRNGVATISCGEFILTADKILNAHIELTDDASLTQFKKSRPQKSAKKRDRN